MPQKERLRVWRGELKKTAGGLTKNDLRRNARGKIVSRKKSQASTNENNLGKWLRSAGDSFEGLLQEKGMPVPKRKGQGNVKYPKAPKPQVDKKIKQVAAPKPKPKPAPKVVTKPKPKPKPKPKVVKALPKPKSPKRAAAPKKKAKSPVKVGQIKNLAKISVGNILRPKKKATYNKTGWPEWAKKQTGSTVLARIQKDLNREGGNPKWVDWPDLQRKLKRSYAEYKA